MAKENGKRKVKMIIKSEGLPDLRLVKKGKVIELKECKKAAKPENWEIALPNGVRQQSSAGVKNA